jgi:hypothetical protein
MPIPQPGDPDFDWSQYGAWNKTNGVDARLAAAKGTLDKTTRDFGPVRPEIQAQYPMPKKSPLADHVRSQYPGHYDDMTDSQLEAAVLAKHPEMASQAVHTNDGVIGDRYTGPDTFTGGFSKEAAKMAPSLVPAAAALGLALPTGGASLTELPPLLAALAGAGTMGGASALGHGINAIAGNDDEGAFSDIAENAAFGALPGAAQGLAKGAGSIAESAARILPDTASTLRSIPGAGAKINSGAEILDRLGKFAKRFTPESPVEPFMPNSSGYSPAGGFAESAEGVGAGSNPLSAVDRYSANTSGFEPPTPGPEPPTDPIDALKKLVGMTDEPEMSVVHELPTAQDVPSAAEVDDLVRQLIPKSPGSRSPFSEVDLTGDVAPSLGDVAGPSSPAISDPSRMLPGLGETSETFKQGTSAGKQLRPGERLFDLINEYADRQGLGKVTGLKDYPMPSGDDELARAIRQRGHVQKAASKKASPRKSALDGLKQASGQ